MMDTLCHSHTFKDVFLLGQAGRNAKAKGNAYQMEPVKKWKVDEETYAETWTPSKMQREFNAWQHDISHGRDVSKELGADLIFPKIQLMSHWVEQIPQYGAFQQNTAESHE